MPPTRLDNEAHEQRNLLRDWHRQIYGTHRAHTLSANHFASRKYWLGVPAVLLSTFVGTSVFAMISREPEPWIQIVVGLASVAAAMLGSLQTFLGYAERAEKHRLAGAQYLSVARELEQMLQARTLYDQMSITDIRRRMDQLEIEAPNNPERFVRFASEITVATPPGAA